MWDFLNFALARTLTRDEFDTDSGASDIDASGNISPTTDGSAATGALTRAADCGDRGRLFDAMLVSANATDVDAPLADVETLYRPNVPLATDVKLALPPVPIVAVCALRTAVAPVEGAL